MGIFDGLRQAWDEAGRKVDVDTRAKGLAHGATPIDWDTWDAGIYVAGVTFRQKEIKQILAASGMRGNPGKGQAFYLEGTIAPEPTNKHDSGAIACKAGGLRFGYIPKEKQASVRRRTPKGNNNWTAKATYAFWPKPDGTWVAKYWV